MPTLPVLLAEPPLDPDADTARTWMREELARPEYTEQVSLMDRIDRWLSQHLPDGLDVGGSPAAAIVILLLVLATVAVIAWQVKRFRGGSRAPKTSTAVFDEAPLSAREHRERADAAYAAGDLEGAVVEYFRAMTRALEERTIITERLGRTAHEVALEGGVALPDHVAALRNAAVSVFGSSTILRQSSLLP